MKRNEPSPLQPVIRLALALCAGWLACATVEALAQDYQGGPGGYPYYQYSLVMPGSPGPTDYLMPDGGRWRQYPNVMPGAAPPPVYIPPEEPREIIIHHYHHGYDLHDHIRFHRHN